MSNYIFTTWRINMTWFSNSSNWNNITHKLIEFMKLWNLTYNIIEVIVYTNYLDMFMITITWTQHNMNYSCLSSEINLNWMWKNMKTYYQKTTNIFYSKYVRYKLNYSIYSYKNKIMRYSQSQWKILRKFSNQNHMLTHNYLYLKNIMIWLIFLRNNILTNCSLIKKNMILKLNWNQKKSQTSDFYTACHEKNYKCYNNILISILWKNSYNQVIFHLCYWCYSQKNQIENYNSALIIKFWTQL